MAGAPSDTLRDTYETNARIHYTSPAGARDLGRKFEFVRSFVEKQLPCDAYLDAGCGDGRYLAAIGSSGTAPARIVGTDLADRMLETAGAAARAAGVSVELVQANLEQLPFPDASFDVVLCTQVIEHLLDPQLGMAELARVLRPGGTLVVSTDSATNTVSRVLNAPRRAAVTALGLTQRRVRVHFPHADFHPDDFVRLIEDAGLIVHEQATARFHFDGALGRSRGLQALLDRADRALSPHRVGDIVLVVAERP